MANTQNAILKALIDGEVKELLVKSNVQNIYMEDGTTLLSTKLAEIIADAATKATKEEMTDAINTAINNLVDGAPEAMNTLKEVADALAANDEVVAALNAAIGNKADKTAVEALTTTVNTLQSKLDGIEAGAQVNKIEKIYVNGTEQAIDEKGVNISVPTGALAGKDEVTADDLSAELKETIENVEDANHSHENMDALNEFATGDKAKLDEAYQKVHDHTNKSTLDGITDTKVAGWDAAEQNAKTYADGIVATEKSRAEAAEKVNADAIAELAGKGNVYVSATQPAELKANDLWIQTL